MALTMGVWTWRGSVCNKAHGCVFCGGEPGRERVVSGSTGQDGARVGRGDGGVFEGDGGAHV